MQNATSDTQSLPDTRVSVREVFGIDSDMSVPAFSRSEEHVPDTDKDYLFDRDTTLAILAGFSRNRRVMITGYHGTGKSTHIEQVAARLNWPCVRINLDSHVSRVDLVGKDAIVLKDGKQVTEFKRRHPALGAAEQHRPVFRRIRCRTPGRDVRDSARARGGRSPHAARPEAASSSRTSGSFRLFATTNTIGLGDTSGPVPWHPADQPGADGPLVHRRDAELSPARPRGRHRPWPRFRSSPTSASKTVRPAMPRGP